MEIDLAPSMTRRVVNTAVMGRWRYIQNCDEERSSKNEKTPFDKFQYTPSNVSPLYMRLLLELSTVEEKLLM